jgi:hypothetical protein
MTETISGVNRTSGNDETRPSFGHLLFFAEQKKAERKNAPH